MRLSFAKKRRSKKTRRKTHEMRRKKLKRRTLKKRRKKRMKASGNSKIDKGLQYADKLVGIRYAVSSKAPTKDSCPFWNRDGPAPSIEDVKKGGLACVGVTNLIRRHLGLKIPTEKMYFQAVAVHGFAISKIKKGFTKLITIKHIQKEHYYYKIGTLKIWVM